MTFRKILFALGILFAVNAFAQNSFSIYFNGESPTANCHVDSVSNAKLSTTGSGNLVATATTPLSFSSACGISGNAQQLTFGPAQPLKGPASTLAAGSNVAGSFTVLPLNAASCTVVIATTSGSGTATGPASGYVCGSSGAQSCASSTPIGFNASFTNTGTGASAYQATVTCQAATGASPATLTSQATVNQSGNSGGTPAANFTFTTSGLTANFTDTSTDPGGTITWSWNFGDATALVTTQSPSHAYTAAGTYSVTLTVTDSLNGQQSSKTQSVTVSTTATCPTIASSTSGIASFTRLTGNQNVFYFGSGAGTGNQSVDVTSFASAWQGSWPGSMGIQPVFTMPTNTYMAQQFVVPNPYFANAPAGLFGQYQVGTSRYQAPISMTISTKCGDFSNPATYPTSSVVAGCWANKQTSSAGLQWSKSYGCTLTDGQTYFLNIINADISAVTPTGGTAASSKTGTCGSSCDDPFYYTGNFNTYHP